MKKDFLLDANEMRYGAEKVYKESEQNPSSLVKQADLHRLVHDLQVHQIELEMQNEELLGLSADLKASNKKYTNLYEFSPIGYFTLSRTGIIQQVNLTGTRILGEERIKLLERRFELFVAYNNRPAFRAILEKAFESRLIETYELNLTKEDGHPIYVKLKAIASHDGKECRLTMVDTTAKKLLEAELIIKDQAMASSLNAMALIDLFGNLSYVNTSFLNLWGYKTDQEVLGQSASFLWESEKSAKEIYDILLRKGSWSGEVVARRKDGKLRDVYLSTNIVYDQDGVPTSLMASCIDITDSKKAEVAIKSSEEKYRLLTENASDVIWILNLASIKFAYISPSILSLRGFTTEEAMNESLEEVLTPNSLMAVRAALAKNIKNFIKNPKAPNNYISEVQQPCKNGDIIWTEISTKYRYNSDGYVEIVGVSRSIEERKKSEKELIIAKQQAEAASNAQSQFLANMSHEIRTPMTGLMGMLQVLKTTELTKEQAEYIEIAKTASDSLLMVINDILEYSKIEAGKLKIEKLKFNLNEFISEIEIMFKPSVLNKGLALTMLIEDNVPHNLLGDSFRLRQVLSNIIGNAIKFTQKGSIELIVRKLEKRNNEVKLEWLIQDTGIGLSQIKIKDIFNRFIQADSSITRQYGGTGLGLSICKGLVELMQGEIWVESKEGQGSKFYFTCVLNDSTTET